jgi:hypothetical protein
MQGLRQPQQTVELVIDDGCICNKSAAKSLLQVEMRLRPGSAGLADRTLFFEPPAASARTVPQVVTGRQGMTRKWQSCDYINIRADRLQGGGPQPVHLADCQDHRSWHHDELIAVQPCA